MTDEQMSRVILRELSRTMNEEFTRKCEKRIAADKDSAERCAKFTEDIQRAKR
jgi:hypothetical protein